MSKNRPEYYRPFVIAEIEGCCNVKLQQVRKRPKWRRDKSGRNWWVLIGKGYWHGIPVEMVNDELEKPTEGVLVIALLKRTTIDVYRGSARQFCSAKEEFSFVKGSQPQYEFNCEVIGIGKTMKIKEEPTITLNKFSSVPIQA